MRITDMTALSGFARSTAEAASDFATLVYNLVLDIRYSYRPRGALHAWPWSEMARQVHSKGRSGHAVDCSS